MEKFYKKKFTITDIAKFAETSKTTVSFYLNGKYEKMSGETKRRIEEVIKETNYSPSIAARCLTSKRSNLIGVVVGDLGNPFSANIVKGIDSICRKNDFQIIVGSSGFKHKNEMNYVNKMIDMGVDGFIVQPTMEFLKIASEIEKTGKQMVLLDSVTDEFKGNWVKTDNLNDTKRAMEHLIEKGFEKLILMTEDPTLLMARVERKIGFEEICNEKNIENEIIIIDKKIENKKLMKIINENINYEKRTAIFCINGTILKKVFDTMREEKNDLFKKIGLIGYDNWEWTQYATPAITNIEQPTYEEGKYAATLLINMINGDKKIESKIFKSKINWNESTNIV